MTYTIAGEIREFIVTNFLFGQNAESLTENQSLLDAGIIDSTGILELVAFLEQQFNITVADSELLPDNLDSIDNAARFVTRKQAEQGAPVAS